MANLKFYSCNALALTYSSTSADAAYPLTNLQTNFEDEYWKSANSTNLQQLAADANALSYSIFNYAIINNSNIAAIVAAGGTVRLQCATDSGFTTGLVTIKRWQIGYDAFNAISAITSTARYWRIYFENCASIIPYVAIFWLGTVLDLGDVNSYPYEPALPEYDTNEVKAISGHLRTSQTTSGARKYWKLPLKNISSTVQNNLATFFATAYGKLNPFYFTDADGNFYQVMFDMDKPPTTVDKAGAIGNSQILLKTIMVS
jgi:hypothetical protein